MHPNVVFESHLKKTLQTFVPIQCNFKIPTMNDVPEKKKKRKMESIQFFSNRPKDTPLYNRTLLLAVYFWK